MISANIHDRISNLFKNNWFHIFLLLIPIYIVIIFIYFGITISSAESARSLISTIIQSEATIMAIVISLSLVAVQLAASNYSTRLMDIFKEDYSLWILLGIYIFAIIYGLIILGLIDTSNVFKLENEILITYFLAIFAFGALIPYIINVLDLMKPSTVIDKLAKRITKENILFAIEEDWKMNEKEDPIQPIMDIMHTSLMKYDYGTFREGLKVINKSIELIFENEELIGKEEESILINVIWHFKRAGKIAINIEDEDSAIEIIHRLSLSGELSAKGKYMDLTHDSLYWIMDIGKIAIEKKLELSGTIAIDSLKKLGIIAGKENLEDLMSKSANFISFIGEVAAKQKLENTVMRALFSLRTIGEEASKQEVQEAIRRAVFSIRNIGIITIEQNMDHAVLIATVCLRDIGDKILSENEFNTVIVSLEDMIKIAREKEDKKLKIDAIFSSFKWMGEVAIDGNDKEKLNKIITSLEGLINEESFENRQKFEENYLNGLKKELNELKENS